MPAPIRLILASASPRRARILESLGLEFTIRPADADETIHAHETPVAAVRRLARRKALAHPVGPRDCVVAADTVVVLGARILGKPASPREARSMLRALAGRTHIVATGVAVATSARVRTAVDLTRVSFRPMTAKEIARYVLTGEPLDKAGAYGIQGHGGALVDHIEGDYFNVVGLPCAMLARLLASLADLPPMTPPKPPARFA